MRIYLAAKITIALAEGGMRFTFPPYGKKDSVRLEGAHIIAPTVNSCILGAFRY